MRVSGKEARFRRHENHCISKTIVESAKVHRPRASPSRTSKAYADGSRLGAETLATGCRAGRSSSSSAFLSYKATLAGIPIVQVDPRNTSKTCSVCGHCERGNRKSQAEFAVQALRVLRQRRLERRPEHPGTGSPL